MTVPAHYKQIAMYLREKAGEPASVATYRDSNSQRPIDIGKFGRGNDSLYSTIGMSDRSYRIPKAKCEFAVAGKHSWLPNALASSIYWLEEREITEWPLVCEDVVRLNTKSTFRHVLFIPSEASLSLAPGHEISWLFGIPIKDTELQMSLEEATLMTREAYPAWPLRLNA